MVPKKRKRAKHVSIGWVEQLSTDHWKGGCGAACLAMLLGVTYQRITEIGPRLCHHCGIEEEDLDQFLAEQGYAVQRRWRWHWFSGKENEWPLAPWTSLHLALVWQTADDSDAHYVVMDSKGVVYDPADSEFRPRKLSDYHDVSWIAGIHQVGEV